MLAIDAAKYLHGLGIVVFDENGILGNAFIDTLPSEPGYAVGIYSSGGAAPETRNPMDRPALQFITRSATPDPRPAEELAQRIWTAFHGLAKTELAPGGTYVGKARAAQSRPVYIGTDDNDRPRYSVNIQFVTRRD